MTVTDWLSEIIFPYTTASVYYRRAKAYYEKGDYEGAIVELTKAIGVYPKDGTAHSLRGDMYAQQKLE
jgi:Flp pilus assembly protein TadD